MKKTVSYMMIAFLLFSLLLPVCAAVETQPAIVDGAGYLMQFELAELGEMLDRLRETYDFDVAIYTEDEMSGFTAEASADDIYDYMGYGAGENDDGILLYICADTREYHFTTHGKGLTYFTDNGLLYLESAVLPYLQEDDYYGAFNAYIETAEELLILAENGTPYDEKQYGTGYLLGVILGCLLLPLLIAFWRMNRKLKQMKTAVSNEYAANYIKPGSMNIAVSRDLFLYSRITKTERAKSNSGTHTSSSGRTHGGRGGSF